MIIKWKKKASKQELFDIIKIQEEEISRLNKEKMNFYVVIRNEKLIRIDKQGLDYMVEIEQQLKQKENIIKEVKETVKWAYKEDEYQGGIYTIEQILDKEK